MKKLIIGSMLTASVFLAGSAQAKHIDKNLEVRLVRICEAIKSNSKLKVHLAIKDSGIKARKISKGLMCNGNDPVTFAILNNAPIIAKFIAKKGDVDYEALLAKL